MTDQSPSTMNLASDMLHAFWTYVLESAPWLLVGFAVAGALHALVPVPVMQRWLGAGRSWAVTRAAVLGIPLPLCSCSVIPTAAALRSGGASRGSTAAFAISTPEVDAPSISLTWGMIGPWLAIARPIAALGTALGVGVLIDRFVPERGEAAQSDPVDAECGSTACCAEPAPTPASEPLGFVAALRFSLVTLPRNLALWILLGLALSAVVSALVPDDFFEQVAQVDRTGLLTKLAALVVGIPWYVCATASTPLAAALIATGLSPGAALVFLLAGPATNPATIGWVWRDLGARALGIYLGGIAIGALATGIALDAIMPSIDLRDVGTAHVHDHASPARIVMAIVMLAILAPGLIAPIVVRLRTRGGSAPQASCCDHDVEESSAPS